MTLFTLAMIGRIMVIIGVLVPMLVLQNSDQKSPENITFWAITIVGLIFWLTGRFGESIVRRKTLQSTASPKETIKVEEVDEEA